MLRLLAVLAVLVSVAAVHGKGVLKLADRRLVGGDTVDVSGEKFLKASSLVMLLVGTAGRTRLGEVRTDSGGLFRATPVLSADLLVGAYRLVVLASDGDEVGALDEVVPATAPRRALEAADGSAEPSAQPLALERARSPWVMGGTLAVILVAAVVGGLLLRRPTAH